MHGKVNFKGNLFFARSGDIIYSKIDVRNGAIGIVPEKFPVIAVTSEFPVYQINREVALPEYIQLVFRTNHFRNVINGMVSGTSGRKRVQPDELENVEIPLPTLAEQRVIVARRHKAKEKIATARGRAEKRKAEIEAQFLVDIGLQSAHQADIPKAFAVWWKDIDRWGVQMVGLNTRARARSIFPEMRLSELCSIGSGGTPSRQRRNYYGGSIPWVKTSAS